MAGLARPGPVRAARPGCAAADARRGPRDVHAGADAHRVAVVVEGRGRSDTLATDAWKVTVRSVGVAQDSDIRDVKGPLSIPRNWWLLAPWILGGLALVAGGYWLYRRYRHRNAPPSAPVHSFRRTGSPIRRWTIWSGPTC